MQGRVEKLLRRRGPDERLHRGRQPAQVRELRGGLRDDRVDEQGVLDHVQGGRRGPEQGAVHDEQPPPGVRPRRARRQLQRAEVRAEDEDARAEQHPRHPVPGADRAERQGGEGGDQGERVGKVPEDRKGDLPFAPGVEERVRARARERAEQGSGADVRGDGRHQGLRVGAGRDHARPGGIHQR